MCIKQNILLNFMQLLSLYLPRTVKDASSPAHWAKVCDTLSDINLTISLRDSALNYMIQYQQQGVGESLVPPGWSVTMSAIVQSYWLPL